MITPLSATPAELIAAYRRGPQTLRDAIAGMDAEALKKRPIAGKMSSMEVVCHIVDSDQFMCDRVKRIIATDRPLIVGIESVDYLRPLSYHDRDLALDFALLDAQRAQLAADLDKLAPEAWARIGIHTENGAQTVHEMFHHAVEHLEGHVVAIAEKRAALGL